MPPGTPRAARRRRSAPWRGTVRGTGATAAACMSAVAVPGARRPSCASSSSGSSFSNDGGERFAKRRRDRNLMTACARELATNLVDRARVAGPAAGQHQFQQLLDGRDICTSGLVASRRRAPEEMPNSLAKSARVRASSVKPTSVSRSNWPGLVQRRGACFRRQGARVDARALAQGDKPRPQLLFIAGTAGARRRRRRRRPAAAGLPLRPAQACRGGRTVARRVDRPHGGRSRAGT